MIDWSKSMKQTYEFYTVNPNTGMNKTKLYNVTGASVSRDLNSDTQVSGSIEYDGELDEEYVRIYLVAEQGNERENVPLITMLCQTPSTSYDGKRKNTSITGYSPLLELQNVYPPFGYTIPKYPKNGLADNDPLVLNNLIPELCKANMRTQVLDITENLKQVNANRLAQPFVTDPQNTWFEVINTLVGMTDYMFRVTPLGVTYFGKRPKIKQMAPIWAFDSQNSSILYSDISIDRDLYGIPNVIEVITTSTAGTTLTAVVSNDDSNSPTSTVSRGRKVVKRIVNPEDLGKLPSNSDGSVLQQYAQDILEKANELEYKISYKHGYCGVDIGDCVYINYPDAGLNFVKALVVSQKIDCKTGCQVEETAVFTKRLYDGGKVNASN